MAEEDPGYNGFATKAIHFGYNPEDWKIRPHAPPLITSTTFISTHMPTRPGDYVYSRYAHPNKTILETKIAALEDAKYGLTFSSGMATLMSIVELLVPGNHVICDKGVYGGTRSYFRDHVTRKDIKVSFMNCTNIGEIKNEIKDNTKLILVESLTNPMLRVLDIKSISDLTKDKGIILVVDNTFLTPYFFNPLKCGADIVMHSLTKYMNGHDDVTMGALVTNNEDIYKTLKVVHSALGAVPSPFDLYMVTRSLKTLPIRMEKHMDNAKKVANSLKQMTTKVEKVIYPGLESHPDFTLAKKQFRGFSGVVGFYIKGDEKKTLKFIKNLKFISLCGSLGFTETAVSYPEKISHADLTQEERTELEITGSYLRLSVGLEDFEDIENDLKQALRMI